MYFCTNTSESKRKYMNADWILTDNKEDALQIEICYICPRLIRIKIGEQYLACSDKEPFLSTEKIDATIFMVEKYDDYIYYVSIKYFYLTFTKNLLSSDEHSYINPLTRQNRINISKLKFKPNLIFQDQK